MSNIAATTNPTTNNQKELHGCNTYTMQQCNSNIEFSLKALSIKVLQQNLSCKLTNSISTKVDNKLQNNFVLKHGISVKELQEFLGEDWDDYKDNPEALSIWADLIFKNQLMKQGKVPDNFTATTWCNLCGYVYVPPSLTNEGTVLACPWCWNRVKGLPIPKPVTTNKY